MQYYVYRFLDKYNNVIYVGKTNDLMTRIDKQHFNKSGHLDKQCYLKTKKVEYQEFDSGADMSIYEVYFINKYLPYYNNSEKYEYEKMNIRLKENKWTLYKNIIHKNKVIIEDPNIGLPDFIQWDDSMLKINSSDKNINFISYETLKKDYPQQLKLYYDYMISNLKENNECDGLHKIGRETGIGEYLAKKIFKQLKKDGIIGNHPFKNKKSIFIKELKL